MSVPSRRSAMLELGAELLEPGAVRLDSGAGQPT